MSRYLHEAVGYNDVYSRFSGYLHVRILEGDLPHTLQRLGVDSHRLKPDMNIGNNFKAEGPASAVSPPAQVDGVLLGPRGVLIAGVGLHVLPEQRGVPHSVHYHLCRYYRYCR